MKRRAPDPRIHLWWYPDGSKNAGWHLTADGAGCDAVVAAIDDLVRAPAGSERSLRTLPPTAAVLSVPGRRWKPQSATQLTLSILHGPEERRDWSLEDDGGHVTLLIGRDRVDAFRAAIEDIKRDGGDHGMGPERNRPRSQFLTFWWFLPE